MLNPANDTLLLSGFNEDIVVLKFLDGRFRDKDVKTTFDSVEGDWEMCAYGSGYTLDQVDVIGNGALSGVKIMTASPGFSSSIAALSGKQGFRSCYTFDRKQRAYKLPGQPCLPWGIPRS